MRCRVWSPAGGAASGWGGAAPAGWLVGVVVGGGGGGGPPGGGGGGGGVTALCSDYRVQSLHCAITITGEWQPARCWWCARQLSNFPASRLVGVVAGGGGCVCVGTAKP